MQGSQASTLEIDQTEVINTVVHRQNEIYLRHTSETRKTLFLILPNKQVKSVDIHFEDYSTLPFDLLELEKNEKKHLLGKGNFGKVFKTTVKKPVEEKREEGDEAST